MSTKVEDCAITEGEKLYMQIRSDIEKGIKYFAITVKEVAGEYLKYQKICVIRVGEGDFKISSFDCILLNTSKIYNSRPNR